MESTRIAVISATKDREVEPLPASRLTRARRRRVILVDAYWTRDKDPRVPLGHASLLAALRARTRADVRSIVVPVNEGALAGEGLVATILDHAGDLPATDVDVALGVYVWSEEIVQSVIQKLRATGFTGRIVLGGPQISYCAGGLEGLYPGASAFVRGYGELALCALAEDPGTPKISGVHYAGTEDQKEHAAVPLHELASPWLTGVIPIEGQRFVRWETQRGCPYRCSFCQHRDADGRGVKRFELDRIFSEIDWFCRSGVEEIAVLDPIFNNSRERHAVAILEHFQREGFRGRLSLQCRGELLNDEFLDAASRLRVRLELGLQTIHEVEGKAVRRQTDLARVERALEAIRLRKIEHEVSIIFGLPEQTLASFKETVRWCLAQRVAVTFACAAQVAAGAPCSAEAGSVAVCSGDGRPGSALLDRLDP